MVHWVSTAMGLCLHRSLCESPNQLMGEQFRGCDGEWIRGSVAHWFSMSKGQGFSMSINNSFSGSVVQ